MNSGYHKKKFNALKIIEGLFKDKNEHIYVAEENKKIIGYRSFNKKGFLADHGYLSVLKKFHRKGIGDSLMNRGIKEAKKLGCKKMIINVKNDNFNAISLYNKLNFRVIDSHKKGKVIKLVMEKKL